MLLVMRRSSTVLSADTDDTCSNDLSAEPPSAATMSASVTPRSRSNKRNFLFSSSTFLAAPWISAEVSIPTCSQLRNLASSSCRYSLRRARERPVHELLVGGPESADGNRSRFGHARHRRNHGLGPTTRSRNI